MKVVTIFLALFLFLSGLSAAQAQGVAYPPLPSEIVIRPQDWVMTRGEAQAFMKDYIGPALDAVMDDPQQVPGLRDRLLYFVREHDKDFAYLVVPAYHPSSKEISAIVDYDMELDKPVLIIFLPFFRDKQKNRSLSEFQYIVALTYAHEIIHIEHVGKFRTKERKQNWGPASFNLLVADEALTHAKMVREIIRPLRSLNKPLWQRYISLSDTFARMGNDENNEKWSDIFAKGGYFD